MCQDLFDRLLESGGPEQKTIVFCLRDVHADAATANGQPLCGVVAAVGREPASDLTPSNARRPGRASSPDLQGRPTSLHRRDGGPADHGRRRALRAEHRLFPLCIIAHRVLPDGRPGNADGPEKADVHGLRLHERDATVRGGVSRQGAQRHRARAHRYRRRRRKPITAYCRATASRCGSSAPAVMSCDSDGGIEAPAGPD